MKRRRSQELWIIQAEQRTERWRKYFLIFTHYYQYKYGMLTLNYTT